MKVILFLCISIIFSACNANNTSTNNSADTSALESSSGIEPKEILISSANIRDIRVSGAEGSYTFSVKVESYDKGCEYFANWWEVLREDGSLVYRRILFHSHVSEQPFTRSGGSVNIKEDEVVYIRAHMNHNGYGPNQFVGSVAKGFSEVAVNKVIESSIELQEPQEQGCAF